MGISNLRVITRVGESDPLSNTHHGNKQRLQRFRTVLLGILGGGKHMPTANTEVRRGLIRAFGKMTISGSSGTVGCVINGVTVTVTHGTTDTLDGGLEVAAINASTDPLVQYLVEAGQLAGTLTLSGALAGVTVNVCGFVFRAVGTTTPADLHEFTIAGSDTADAASLAAAINKHPVASQFLRATNSAGAVTVWCTKAAVPTGYTNTLVGATGITAGASTLVAGAAIYITSLDKGEVGNQTTIAASGTGWTASGARLTGGTSSIAL